jgi:uncharacterized protein with PIN domain
MPGRAPPALCMLMTGRSGLDAKPLVARRVQTLRAELVPFTQSQADRAVDAFLRYGKGRQRGACLKFGDCCS